MGVLLVLGGCFNPDDLFPVRGVVESVDPVAGQRVELLRKRRNVFGPCEGLRPYQETFADEAGGYGFDLFRAATQVLAGPGNFCFQVHTEFPSGSSASVVIEDVRSELELPAMRDWKAELRRARGSIEFSPLQDLPREEEAALLVHRVLLLTPDGGLAWRADDVVLQEGALLPRRVQVSDDARVMSEFGGELSVQARFIAPSPERSFDAELPPLILRAQAAETIHVPQRAQVPWSHRADCPEVAEPCPLTDRQLTPVELGGAGQVRISFIAPTVPSAVVLRGFASKARSVEVILTDLRGADHKYPFSLPVSLYANDLEVDPTPLRDGGWVYRLRPEARFALLPLDEVSFEVRAVTVRFPGGVERMSELSVYSQGF